ncbi:DUF932 domain-containing protein [Actinomadura rupiterrae]|uniref:DUF932 domain-containing protein n=1 Tax=Actinomadura rupiterrae TaxID=559627 RepID=UPI0020A4EEC4|nr:DUF932 domain-containing protein [Actinomadura rupiterrae]MCP2339182.1 phage/plasmid-like protein (TIGR03299 family) [Actinomadura rupiterrae]
MSSNINEAFAAERSTQIDTARARQAAWDQRVASGKLTPVGNGRYRVTDPGSYDNGEILVNQGGLILPQHGLDLTGTGDAALYSAVPAWHGLGQIIPGGISDIDEVLRLAGIAWQVERRSVRYSVDGEIRTVPDAYVTVRDDTHAPLGVVGGKYREIQNRSLFRFLEDLVGQQGVVWESAGSLRDGRKVFVSMRVPQAVTIDPGGLDDTIELFLVAINSHDGTSTAQTVVTPWRPVCANTERFAVRDAQYRWTIRHTSRALDRLEEARRTLGLTSAYAARFGAEETALARTDLAVNEFDRVISDLWEPASADDPQRTRTNDTRRRDTLHAMYRTEAERAGRTAYAAERTITDYLDHVAPRRPGKSMTEEIARATAALEGTDDDVKTRAHRRLMRLVGGGVQTG